MASLAPEELSQRLADFLQRAHDARSVRIEGMRLLTGGASRRTWSFDAVVEHADGRTETFPLVLRADSRPGTSPMTRETEYRLLKAAHDEGVLVPAVHGPPGDESLGMPSFLMERIEGETIARRLLRDDAYAEARKVMTGQLGRILASVHRLPVAQHGLDGELQSPAPGKSPAETELDRFEQTYRAITPDPHPAFELALRWLRRRLPPLALSHVEGSVPATLVHGDFRIGNVIFGPEGVRAVLDWELAHTGDPMEDLGWLCVRAWRFGNDDLPVGGLGTREELWQAYEAAAGHPVDREAARWWEVFGNLRWGVITISQAQAYLTGMSKSVELAAIGRRTAETEWELLHLMEKG